jgi:Fe-S oxidoreductase
MIYQGFAEKIQQLPAMAPKVELPADERVRRAVTTLVNDTHADEAVWLETCVHCGQCAHACHYFTQTQEPKYAKIELYRRIYKRELGPFRWLYKLLGKSITVQDLEEMQELVYDSEYRVAVPLDKEQAEVLVLTSAVDIVMNGNGLLATAKVMNHLGIDWTICSEGFESANFGLLSGNMELLGQLADKAFKLKIEQVDATGAESVVVSCASCRLNFEAGRANNHWDKTVDSLVELVAEQLGDFQK